MKYIKLQLSALLVMFSLLAGTLCYANTPSQAVHAHPIDSNGYWDGTERSVYAVGEMIKFFNPYKIPFWQEDGWSIKNLQTGEYLGCVPLYSSVKPYECVMRYWDIELGAYVSDSCDDANQLRSFDKPGVYRVKVMSTGPGYCAGPTTYKDITITSAPNTSAPDDFSWLVPVLSILLH